jgi:ATP-binding cassette subfamily B protein
MVWLGAPGWTALSLGLSLLQAGLPIAGLFLLKSIINSAVAAAKSPLAPQQLQQLMQLIAAALLVQLLSALSRSLSQIVSEAQAARVTEHMEDLLHRKSVEVDLEYYETPGFKNTLHRAQQEAPFRPTRIVFGLAQLAQSSLSLLAVGGVVWLSMQWTYALIFVLVAVPGLWVRLRQARKMYEWQVERTPVERQAEYYNWMLTGSYHAKENRLFNIGDVLRSRAATLRHGLNQRRLHFTAQRAAGEFLTQSTGLAPSACWHGAPARESCPSANW